MFDYCQQLIDWQNQQQQKVRERFPSARPLHDYTEHYHAEIENRDILLVTFGDSWTWGDKLDPESRLKQVYGSIVSNQLNADWINVGCRGWGNSFVLEHLDFLLTLLKQTAYKKIYFVITLTENGRDLVAFPHFRFNYKELYDRIGSCELFYDTLLNECENFWVKQIKQTVERMDSRFCMVVGHNFVWHNKLVDQLNEQVQILNLNWIECLADQQQLPRPIRTNLATGWIFDTINEVHDILKIKATMQFKQWALPYIEKATQVNEWLDSSPMNYKEASKHPNAEGHKIWANYILKNLK